MAPQVSGTEPTSYMAGTTAQWTRSFSDFPSSAYSLVYYFAGPDQFEVTATPNGDGYLVTLAANDTAEKPAGVYQWRACAEAGSDSTLVRYPVAFGTLTLTPNFAIVVGGALQDEDEKTLAVIEAALAGRLTADIQDYQIAGRVVTKIPIMELMTIRGVYAARVWRKRHPGQSYPSHAVRFRAPR